MQAQIPIVTFLSDFGTRDGYVGSVKGVIKSIGHQVDILDVSHDIEPFNIKQGAFALINYYNQYPKGTVHLAVVDPGVGGDRRAIILKTKNHYFVGPDNGIFQYITDRESYSLFEVDESKFELVNNSTTFHARDIFGPVAAKLALGLAVDNLGIKIDQVKLLANYKSTLNGNKIEVEAISSDHFGNIIFAFSKTEFSRLSKQNIVSAQFKNFKTKKINQYYAQEKSGEPLLLWNSVGFLEVAINQGNAVNYFSFDALKDKLFLTLE